VTVPPETLELRKARGAFFTPAALCDHVVRWAIRDGSEDVLEPSCGDAAFLTAAAARLDELGAGGRLAGVELHADSAEEAARRVQALGRTPDVRVADFFTLPPEPRFDVVVGNPPYVRYQDFTGEARSRSQQAAETAGVSMSNLASSWAAFTIHAALFLRPGGRLGLVLPAELLSVKYAAHVRRFLMERFAQVRLVMFTERVFPGVQEEVVLLMADGYGEEPGGSCELVQLRNAEELQETAGLAYRWTPEPIDGKWNASLLSPEGLQAYSEIGGRAFTTLEHWGDTTLGMVTGNNKYFALSPGEAGALGLPPRELLRISPPGSRHLRGLTLSGRDLGALGRAGAKTLLFRPGDKPSGAALAYIAQGQEAEVDTAYKCRVRTPWWRVPLVKPADVLLTYMNADAFRLCQNVNRVRHLNSVHGLYLRPEYRELGARLLPLATLNSVTLLGGETVGRAYGGGMLKLEPKEADRLPVPTPAVLQAASEDLEALRSKVQQLTRAGELLKASELIDAALFAHLPVRQGDVLAARAEHRKLLARRLARSKG
jgi:adenine-specific DNA-methyltransferase